MLRHNKYNKNLAQRKGSPLHRGLKAELQRLTILVIVLFIAGHNAGHTALVMLLGLVTYWLWSIYNISKLYRWLNEGAVGYPPDTYGISADMGDYFYNLQQRNERAKQSRRQLSERIRNITLALTDGTITLSSNLELEWWNPSAEKLLGLQRNDRGQTITNLIRDPRFVTYINSESLLPPLEMTSPDDITITLMFTAARFGNDNSIILIVQDITRLRNLEQMRQDFVANISHELRTPLTVLSGYIETLQDNSEDLPAPWSKALRHMEQQTARLNALANDLVMLSQLESNRLPPSQNPVDINDLMNRLVTDANFIAGENHQIELSMPEQLSLPGEYKELYSAFSNLTFNAIKHNAEGATISIYCEETQDAISITISDDGIGIDPKHLPRLTERFYRVDQSRASTTGGTGLGLAIVKHVLARHGGELKIESTLGKGSTFTCLFPKLS